MGGLPRNPPRSPPCVLPFIIALAFLSLSAFFLSKVDDFVSQTKTVAGHNLEPTPWHLFPPRTFSEDTRQERTYKIIKCSYLTRPYSTRRNNDRELEQRRLFVSSLDTQKCPDFFRFIHKDLQPWAKTRISKDHVMAAKDHAAFRIVIVGGRIYVDLYYACVPSRLMFTVWALLQLLRRYPGMLPDVDMMFDCMDKPSINRTEHGSFPLPLFRYCTTDAHFDIPFPDRSFWGWPRNKYKYSSKFRIEGGLEESFRRLVQPYLGRFLRSRLRIHQ